MNNISEMLNDISHRPYDLPKGQWTYYQEWNKVLFLHWKIPYDSLRKFVPSKLEIDSFNGDCYVSLVAFTMQKIRPRYLPSFSFISDFDEINLRTYVCNNKKAGVYFLNIQASKSLSVFIAKLLSGLPYEKAIMKRSDNSYRSENVERKIQFNASFTVNNKLENKTTFDKWLTERYCLYLDANNKLFRYDIHHKEWEIKSVDISQLNLDYKIGDTDLSVRNPDLTHFSDGVKVIAWKKLQV